MTKKSPYASECSVAYAMNIIGGKWKIAIIWKLLDGRLRYSELRNKLGNISEGVLINQLKELEANAIIKRIDHHEVPPRVEYELTKRGEDLQRALHEINRWGAEVRAAQPL
jgi:DNA-binding HxlR family transcriptional regulator